MIGMKLPVLAQTSNATLQTLIASRSLWPCPVLVPEAGLHTRAALLSGAPTALAGCSAQVQDAGQLAPA